MIDSMEQLIEFSEESNIPSEDLLLLDLNLSGIELELQSRRIRFELRSENKKFFSLAHSKNIFNFYLALPTVDQSSYFLKSGNLMFSNHIIGKTLGVTEDFCDSSYPRRGSTVLNINPNARTSCKGCKFCYTTFQVPRDKEPIISADQLRDFLTDWMENFNVFNLSHLKQVAIVTGCFSSEQKVVCFLKMAKNVLSEFSFQGELFYFGSQIHSKEALLELKSIKPFGLCFSLECFESKKRKSLLRDIKQKVTIDDIKETLSSANSNGFRTNFSYIVGLESLETIKSGFKEFLPYINSFPIVNVFQSHTGQKELRCNDANEIEYYIKARKNIEEIFLKPAFRPRPWENYRSLWYLKFGDEFLVDIRTPLTSSENAIFNKIVACKDDK